MDVFEGSVKTAECWQQGWPVNVFAKAAVARWITAMKVEPFA